jgi:hypothetical protein
MADSHSTKVLRCARTCSGAVYVEASIKNADDFNQPRRELVTE